MALVTAAGRAANERLRPNRPYQMFAVGLHADLVAPVKPVLIALGLAGAFLLIVLTVNLASLLLARAAARERELAVSRAVGANSTAIVRAMLTEGLFLGLAGGVTGAIAGWWGTRLLATLAPTTLPRLETLALDGRVAVVVVAAGAAARGPRGDGAGALGNPCVARIPRRHRGAPRRRERRRPCVAR